MLLVLLVKAMLRRGRAFLTRYTLGCYAAIEALSGTIIALIISRCHSQSFRSHHPHPDHRPGRTIQAINMVLMMVVLMMMVVMMVV